MDKDFLIKMYAQMYGPEAGPWNLSVANKYLEYRFAWFFEENFKVREADDLCNIGVGAGAWDRYLSYQLKGGSLTSIDVDEQCCEQLKQGLICEENPNRVEIVCADVMTLDYQERFDIVTMVGSTHKESGLGLAMLEKVMSFVKEGGSLYYQTLFDDIPVEAVLKTAADCGMRVEKHLREDCFGFCCRYFKFTK